MVITIVQVSGHNIMDHRPLDHPALKIPGPHEGLTANLTVKWL